VSRWRTEPQRLLLTRTGLLDATGKTWPDFATWCAAHRGAGVALVAGADRVQSLRVPDDLPLADDEALTQYARLQFSHYFGPAAQAWPLALCQRVACALADPQSLADWQATAATHRVRLLSLRPSWSLAASPADGCVAVEEEGTLTWLQFRHGHLVDLQLRHVAPGGREDLLQELQADGGTAVTLQPSELLAASPANPGPDFIAPRHRSPPLVWAWATSAAAACALVAVQAVGQQGEAGRLAEQGAVLDRLARAQPAPAVRRATPSPAAQGRAAAIARQLDTDWGARWADLERALPAGLQLRALDLDGSSLRLEGQADEADVITRLVDRLALQAAPGDEVVLTRLQRPESAADGTGLRFELVRRAGSAR
jgi:hypothetical protein